MRKVGEPERGLATVVVPFKDAGKSRVIHFHFQQQTEKTWRISDIEYPDGPSLVGILKSVYGSGRAK